MLVDYICIYICLCLDAVRYQAFEQQIMQLMIKIKWKLNETISYCIQLQSIRAELTNSFFSFKLYYSMRIFSASSRFFFVNSSFGSFPNFFTFLKSGLINLTDPNITSGNSSSVCASSKKHKSITIADA